MGTLLNKQNCRKYTQTYIHAYTQTPMHAYAGTLKKIEIWVVETGCWNEVTV